MNNLRYQTARHIGHSFRRTTAPLSSTSPDIVLTNFMTSFSYSIIPGPLTSSNHIPVIPDISSSPVLLPIHKTHAFYRTDWDAFKYDANLDMSDLPDVS